MSQHLFFGQRPPVKTDLRRSQFFKSVQNGDLEDMRGRIEIGIDVNFVDLPSKKTPLLVAVAAGNEDAVQILLSANADITARDAQLNTALHLSVGQSNVAMTKRVVEAGCSLEECDCRGDTALLKACRHSASHPHVSTLLQFKCRVDALSLNHKQTPLHLLIEAKCSPDLLQLVLDAKANPEIVDDRESNLPLHLAARSGSLELVRAVISEDRTSNTGKRSYIQRQNRWGCTPHDLAFMQGHKSICAFLQQSSNEVETQHVLDRNERLEREDLRRNQLRDELRNMVSEFQKQRRGESDGHSDDDGAAEQLTDRQMRRALFDAIAAAVETGLVHEYTDPAVQEVRAFLRNLISVDSRIVVNFGTDLTLRVIDVDSQKPYPYQVEVNNGDMPKRWIRIDSSNKTIDDTDGNSGLPYKMVEVPHIVRSEEAAFYNSPNFEDQNEKAPPAIKDSIVLIHAFRGQWVMTIDRLWLPIVDEDGYLVVECVPDDDTEGEGSRSDTSTGK